MSGASSLPKLSGLSASFGDVKKGYGGKNIHAGEASASGPKSLPHKAAERHSVFVRRLLWRVGHDPASTRCSPGPNPWMAVKVCSRRGGKGILPVPDD
jgi:hypothetical protein